MVLNLRAGEIVEVRSESEIRASLDENDTLESLPFMPEMWKYCGRTFRVFKRADKTCVEGAYIRRMKNAVFLEGVRCHGEDHDSCDRMCLIFWKEAWLQRAAPGAQAELPAVGNLGTVAGVPMPLTDTTYFCQSTNLVRATSHLPGWDVMQYVRDIRSGNFSLGDLVRAVFISLYNKIQRFSGGLEYGAAVGDRSKTPSTSLHLQPGDLVEVRAKEEILETLDSRGRNRGLQIDHEMLRFCGGRYRVLKRVERIILETTGKMRQIDDTVILDTVICSGLCRRACPKSSYPFWREGWLKKVE
jgi:hypothetical protein